MTAVTVAGTRIRPAMLSSSIARKQLDHLGDWPKALFATIDQISDIFDGLVAVRETVNPSETEEARAVKYRDAHQRATARVDQLLQDAVGRLVDRERKLQADALARAAVCLAGGAAAGPGASGGAPAARRGRLGR